MEIKKAHCFFEQSGVFKNAFKPYGIDAEDYDIQNNFGETDNVIDLFAEIEKGYDGKPSIFDRIEKYSIVFELTFNSEHVITGEAWNTMICYQYTSTIRLPICTHRTINEKCPIFSRLKSIYCVQIGSST